MFNAQPVGAGFQRGKPAPTGWALNKSAHGCGRSASFYYWWNSCFFARIHGMETHPSPQREQGAQSTTPPYCTGGELVASVPCSRCGLGCSHSFQNQRTFAAAPGRLTRSRRRGCAVVWPRLRLRGKQSWPGWKNARRTTNRSAVEQIWGSFARASWIDRSGSHSVFQRH